MYVHRLEHFHDHAFSKYARYLRNFRRDVIELVCLSGRSLGWSLLIAWPINGASTHRT